MRIEVTEFPNGICYKCGSTDVDIEYFLAPTTSCPYPHYIETCRECGAAASGALSISRFRELRDARKEKEEVGEDMCPKTKREFPLQKVVNDALFVEAMVELLHSYKATLSGSSEGNFEHNFSVMMDLRAWLEDKHVS